MRLNNYFDKIICINLDRRSDRWMEVQQQFKKAGISVERYSAIDGNPMSWNHVRNKANPLETEDIKFRGVAGCMASHVNIWKMAKEKGWKNVLIVEDDCDFVHEVQERFTERINQVPLNWDLLYLGGIHETRGGLYIPDKISQHIVKAKRMITTTCYAIKDTCYDLAINTVLADEPWFHTAVDGYLGAYVQSECNTYAFQPPLAWQRASFSDIVNDHRDYSHMMKNNNIK
tara:strand:- start:9194 stop:9883 length:690 start_codon:yes stop_codon:yes gene_type:complete